MILTKEEKERRKLERRQKKWNETHRIINGIDHKLCKICEEFLPMEENFYFNKTNFTDGHTPYCKECTKEKSGKWIEENYERYLEIKRKQNTNEVSRAIHREMGRKRRKDGRRKEWELRSKDKLRGYAIYRHMHKSHAISDEEKNLCKQYFNFECAYCGLSEEEHRDEYNQQLHMDHVDSEGANDLSNNIPACKICNSSKHTQSLDDWYLNKSFYTEERYQKIESWLQNDHKLNISELT